jgi:hypothetical protein
VTPLVQAGGVITRSTSDELRVQSNVIATSPVFGIVTSWKPIAGAALPAPASAEYP